MRCLNSCVTRGQNSRERSLAGSRERGGSLNVDGEPEETDDDDEPPNEGSILNSERALPSGNAVTNALAAGTVTQTGGGVKEGERNLGDLDKDICGCGDGVLESMTMGE